MPRFAIRCLQPGTERPYTLVVQAPTFEEAARLAALSHRVSPADLPPPVVLTVNDPADRVFRLWIRIALFTLLAILILLFIGTLIEHRS